MSGRSQTDLAERLGTTQSGVSRIERQDDTRISTLVEYVAHLGGRLRLVVDLPNGEIELIVPALSPAGSTEPRRARVIWQNEKSRSFHAVGLLEFDGNLFRFSYAPGVNSIEGFEPFAEFGSFKRVYESPELFDFFARRFPVAADPSFHSVLEALGLSRREATPAELLKFPFLTPSDPVQIVPEPSTQPNGEVEGTFLVSGVRYADAESNGIAARIVERLQPGDPLVVQAEPDNPVNPEALAISVEGQRLGYLPNFLLGDVAELKHQGRSVRFQVERANGPDTDWHLRLLARFTASTAN